MKWLVDGREIEFSDAAATIDELPDRLVVRTAEGSYTAVALRQSNSILISYKGSQFRLERPGATAVSDVAHASGELRASMPGLVVAVDVRTGDSVKKGHLLIVLEAMKTQLPIVAPFDGKVERVEVSVGDRVSEGKLLAFLAQPADTH